ncbi:MAG TPA: aldehyde dehydrogenase family protein [Polyangiaceae bacterium]|nr:aldehyde dehydrogenase family protein [Polyangiaceae bacterium]
MTANEQTECINPATGEIIGYSALHSIDDLRAMIERSRQAQRQWASTPVA